MEKIFSATVTECCENNPVQHIIQIWMTMTRSSLQSSCRDFGYVARDNQTKKYKCHVFRCDVPARAVVRALLESHQQREKRADKKEEEEGRKRYSTEGSSGTILTAV